LVEKGHTDARNHAPGIDAIAGGCREPPMNAAGKVRVGIGGWVFAPWRGVLYPPGLPQTRELYHASRQVTAIEINGTFYGAQKPASFRRWHDETPDDFVFSLKGPRFITHRRDFAAIGSPLDRFLQSGLAELRAKLGPILWQFSPSIALVGAAFAGFLEMLPEMLDGRPLRHVVELRRADLLDTAILDLLRRRGIALARVDDDKYPAFDEPTADFVYARLRRCTIEEPEGYPPEALDKWARRFGDAAAGGRDCFVYFINGGKVRAPAAAQALQQRLVVPE
jgi:uncharacterized protein YecE (DUF72 family)